MNIIFPYPASVGDTFLASNNVLYTYDGVKWTSDGNGVGPYGNSNVVTLLAGFGSNTVSTTGNISGGYIFGNGSQLTGISVAATYGNANAVAYGESGWAGNIIPAGNAVYSLGNATNQWNDLYVSNATIFMNNVPISLGAGNVLTVNGNAVLQNDSNTSISTTGNITTGNVLTGGVVSATGNVRGANFNTVGVVSVTGNVTGNYFIGNGSQLTGLSTSSISNGTSNVNIPTANGNVTVATAGEYTWTFGTDGNLTIPGDIIGTSTIDIDNRATGNTADVNLYSADDILLQARDRTLGSFSEGGDINIYAGDSAEDGDSSGGDIQIFAGNGGAANVDFGGSGGTITLESGLGGAASTGVSGESAASGGSLNLRAGDAGDNMGNIDRGADGGDVFIESGYSTGNTNSGGDIFLNTATGGQNGVSGAVQINIPGYGSSTGGTWRFNANGSTIYPNLTVTRGDRTGTLTGQTLLFGDSTQEAIISTPNGTNDINASQRLVINPGAGYANTTGEGGDIYLYAGRGGDAGGSGGDIKIRGGLGPVNGDGGYINIEGGEAEADGNGGYIEIFGGQSGNAAGGTLYIQGGYGRTGGDANVSGGFGATGPGGDVSIIGGGSANGQAEYGNVFVATGSKNWRFDNTGNLLFPQGGYIGAAGVKGDGTILTGGRGNIASLTSFYANANALNYSSCVTVNADGTLNITTYGDGTGQLGQWTFSNANLTLPSGGIVYETNIPFGSLSGNTIALKPQGGIDADQQLLIYPTVIPGADDNHLHLTTGNLYNTELFLGNDNLYVKLANTGNVVINSNDDVGNSAQWTFGTTGNLTLPGNIIAINYLNGNRVTGGITFNGEAVIGTGTSNTQSGLYLAPDPVSLTNDLYLRVRGNIIDEPTHIHFDTGNNQYYNQYIGDDNKYILLANTGNVVVNTNDNAGNSAQWTFDNFGTLTLPGGSRIRPLGANLDIFAGTGSYVNLITSDESSYMGVSGAGGYVVTAGGTWDFNTNGNLTAPGNISAVGNVISGNLTVGSGTITGGNVNGAVFNGNVAFGTGTVGGSGNITGGNLITTGSGGAITMTGGNITGVGNISAGNISATGNIVLTGSLVGSGASPAPSLSGFSSVSAVTISASGNISANNLSLAGNITSNIGFTGANITINNAPGGNEGAEIKWTLPAVANTSLSGTLVQDVFQNGMRFFESGGNTRGLYMDLGNVPNGSSTAVGYRDIPQVSFTGNTTIATTDAGRHYYSTLSTGNVLTIANNASQGFQVGAAITIVNQGTGNITVAQGSGVTLYLAGNATSGNRTVATFGMATIIKVATNTWFINGTGVS
jgi:hypothetical protein